MMLVVWRGSPPSYLLLPLGLAVEEPVPDDRYHAIYFAMLLAGVGFLLPYNSFITDVDYLHHKYPGGPPTVAPCLPRPAAHSALARHPPETLLGSPFIQILAQRQIAK